jgi:hypothetical protein
VPEFWRSPPLFPPFPLSKARQSSKAASSPAVLSGTPTQSGTFNPVITASNGVSPNAQQTFTLTVNPSVSISPTSIPVGSVGTAYSQTVLTSGGTAPFTLSVSNLQNAIPGITIPSSGASSITISGTPTASGTSTFTITATDSLGSTAVQNFSLTVIQPQNVLTVSASPSSDGTVSANPTNSAGLAAGHYLPGTVVTLTANAGIGYQFSSWSGSADLSSTSANPTTITMNSASESVTANFVVGPPVSLIVNTVIDDAGNNLNCTPNASPTGPGNCSLRDALLEAANLPSSAITFDPAVFPSSNTTAQNTISLTTGTLTIPTNTSITGPTSGSGYTLANLVTVAGGGSSNQFSVFTVNSGVTAASISGLTITNGNSSGYGGGINNSGALTDSNSTFSTNSTVGGGGAGIYSLSGTLNINSCTFQGNTSGANGGGVISNMGTTTVTNSTFFGNSASIKGGGIFVPSGTLTLANSIVSGNSASQGPDIEGAYTDNGGNILGNVNGTVINSTALDLAPLGNYGGPTQTQIPLPGSSAICAGTAANAAAANITADQRGFGLVSAYCPSGSIDAGAVATNYAFGFSTNPPATVYTDLEPINPAPAVSVTESNLPATFATGTVNMTVTASALAGTTTATVAGGLAAFSNLTFTGAPGSDQLTATLSLNPSLSPALSISTSSTGFQVSAPASATIVSPTSGSAFASTTATFTWTAGSGATGYYLWIGTQGVGSRDLYNSEEKPTSVTSYTFTALPLTGIPIYVRLITNINGTWVSNDYQYTGAGPVALTAPTAGTTLPGTSATFTWSASSAATGYYLWIGTQGVGSNDLYNSEEKSPATTSYTFNQLPTNAQTIYVRLITNFNGVWLHNDYTYTAATAAQLTGPALNSTFTGSSATFTWTSVAKATGYYLWIGSTPGGNDIYNSEEKSPATTSYTFSPLPTNGETIYVRLWTNFNGAWRYNDYQFQAANQ